MFCTFITAGTVNMLAAIFLSLPSSQCNRIAGGSTSVSPCKRRHDKSYITETVRTGNGVVFFYCYRSNACRIKAPRLVCCPRGVNSIKLCQNDLSFIYYNAKKYLLNIMSVFSLLFLLLPVNFVIGARRRMQPLGCK